MAGDKTIRLKILADVADHHAKMAALPGVTQKAAAAAAVRWERELTRAAVAAQKAQEKAAKGSGKAWEASAKGLATAGAAVGGLGVAFVKLQDTIAASRDELLDAEARTGIYAETLNGLRLAAEGSGGSFADLEPLLNKFPKTLADTAKGTGSAKDAFAALGIEVANSDGSLRDADTVFKETVAAMGDISDKTELAATATELFGKSGGKLIEALSGGELDDFVAMANKYGTDVGPAAAEASARWQMEMANLKNVVRGTASGLFDFGAEGGEALQVVQIGVVTLGELAKGVLGALTTHFKAIGGGWKALFQGDLSGAMDQFAKGSVVSLVTNLDDAIERAKTAGQEYANYAVTLSDAASATRVVTQDTRDFTTSMDEATEAALKMREAQIAENQAKYDAAFEARAKKIAKLEKERDETLKRRADNNREAMDTAIEEQEEQERTAALVTSGWVSAGEAMSSAIFGSFEENKAAAVAQAIVNGALAATNVLATVPVPGQPAALIAVAAAVAAQMATISSTSIAHSGMAYDRAPDEVDMRLTRRERVLTARGAEAIGGDAAVAAANAGSYGGGVMVVQQRFRHRVFDAFVEKNIKRPASLRSEVRSLVDKGGPVGHGDWVKS